MRIRSTIKPATLPNNLEILVETELFVASHDGDVLAQSLRDDLAVEGIRVLKRQIEQTKGMPDCVGQRLKIQILQSPDAFRRAKIRVCLGRP
jgi:hypothetical protein